MFVRDSAAPLHSPRELGMEKMLLKLAKQLDSLDEASLMALWSKYANITSRFEPTKRWEESCLVFSLIQAKRWKNQLFNYNWSQQRQAPLKNESGDADFGVEFEKKLEFKKSAEPDSQPDDGGGEPCRVLAFKPLPKRLRELRETCGPEE